MPGPGRPLDFQEATGPEPSLWEEIGAAFTDAQVKNSNEEGDRLRDEVQSVWRQITVDKGEAGFGGYQTYNRLMKQVANGSGDTEQMLAALDLYRGSLPEAERGKIPTRDQLVERGREKSLERYYGAQEVLQRSSGDGWSGAAQFTGGAAGAMTDPINIASMLALRYPAQGILATIGIEAAGGVVTQAAIEPQTFSYMNDLGIDYTVEDSVNSILQAGVGAGVLAGTVRALEKGVVRMRGEVPIDELRARYRRAGVDPALADGVINGDRQAALSILRDAALLERENPYRGVDEPGEAAAAAMERHQVETMRADETVMHGAPVTPAPDGPAPPIAGSRTPEGVELVDLATLRRDPYVFQYKDSDMDGVTPALVGVDSWAPERAGLVIAWENADGVRFVVDGHQRHALAQRLTEQGHPPIAAPVFLLREADGISAATARAKAAIKNIGEGSGTALDAAYILRSSSPEDLRGLPPNSNLVKAAGGLARLSDDAWGMVVNGVADERWGALTGQLVTEPALQAQVLTAVQRLDPQSPAAAEYMIRDMLAAPRVESETLDLFGSSMTAELLIAERARVKAAAMAVLGKSRTAFRVALQRQAELEAAGNRLTEQRNREALDADTAAALRLEKDAHLKGWVSDSLSQAAKELRDGASLAEVTGRLVEALRRGEAGGDSGRAAAGGPGRGAEGAGGTGQAGNGRGGQAGGGRQTLEVDLSRSIWRKHQDGADTVPVQVNPTDAQLRKLAVLPAEARKDGGRDVRLRYLRDADNNLYVWRGDLAIHDEIADALKLTAHADDAGRKPGVDSGMVDVEGGKVSWDGLPDRPGAPVSKKSLIDGGAIAWRRELVREGASADDIERVLGWLGGQRKDLVEQVHESFTDAAPEPGATKASLMTELREQVRAYHARAAEGEPVPASLFASDPDVTRMREAQDALRMGGLFDEGAHAGVVVEAGQAADVRLQADEAAMLDDLELQAREREKLAADDTATTPATFVDPETGEARPVADLLADLDRDKQRLQVLQFCAYPGGKGVG